MTVLTAMEIASNYPNGDILIEAYKSKTTEKWFSFMYLLREGKIHKLMLSFDETEEFKGWETEEEAKAKMDELAQAAITHFKN